MALLVGLGSWVAPSIATRAIGTHISAPAGSQCTDHSAAALQVYC
jgi:hypothetical protein